MLALFIPRRIHWRQRIGCRLHPGRSDCGPVKTLTAWSWLEIRFRVRVEEN